MAAPTARLYGDIVEVWHEGKWQRADVARFCEEHYSSACRVVLGAHMGCEWRCSICGWVCD